MASAVQQEGGHVDLPGFDFRGEKRFVGLSRYVDHGVLKFAVTNLDTGGEGKGA